GGAGDFDRVLRLLPLDQPEQVGGLVLGDHLDVDRVEALGVDEAGLHLGGDVGIVGAARQRGGCAYGELVGHAADVVDRAHYAFDVAAHLVVRDFAAEQ